MALAQLQSALARLYTDASARTALRDDPQTFATRFQLSPSETISLADSVLKEAEAFARSLARKRFDEAISAAPLLATLLESRLASLFSAYAKSTPLGSSRNPALDTLEFIRFLLTPRTNFLPLITIDGLRHEEARLSMLHTSRRFAIRWVQIPGGSHASRSVVIWWRTAGGRLRTWTIT